jgi:anhydro-N-acetylmuramic acid kinase
MFHRELLRRAGLLKQGCAIHNLGGISNLTYAGKDGKLLAFDTGPGNSWLDQAASLTTHGRQRFDKDGKLALKGEVDGRALDRLLAHPFLRRTPPKSTGRDDFPFQLLLNSTRSRKRVDLVALAARFTVESIAQAYRRHVLRKGLPLKWIFVAGGGAKNPVLMAGIQELLPEVRVEKIDVLGTPSQEVESQAFALFGYRALLGLPLGGSWTGVKGFGPPAHILPGQNFVAVMRGLERD